MRHEECRVAQLFVVATCCGWPIGTAMANSPPVVSSVVASQRLDGSGLVDIVYDLADADGDPCDVAIEASGDGGATWTLPIVAVTGDVGSVVLPGTGKSMVWDSPADVPTAIGTEFRVRICADDGYSQAPEGTVLIPAGSFEMGDHHDGMSDALPLHPVTLSTIHMDRYEVTKELWDTVRTWSLSNGYDLIDAPGNAPDHPVHSVNWYDCAKWANARSEREGRTPCYYTDAGLTIVYKTGEITPYVQ